MKKIMMENNEKRGTKSTKKNETIDEIAINIALET